MLSRVADAIYWLNRYIERAENVARFVDVNITLTLDLPVASQAQSQGSPLVLELQWEPLVLVTGDLDLFHQRYGTATSQQVIQFLTFDRDYPNSILSCLCAARENARSIREILSTEVWQEVNSFYHLVQEAAGRPQDLDLNHFFLQVKRASHTFAGVMDATMTRGEAWHFGQMGRFLERADKTSRILDVKYFILLPSVQFVGTALDEVQWMALLKSASAYEMYRKQGGHRITPQGVAKFLVLSREFPRSIHFCLTQVEESLRRITGTPAGDWRWPVERTIGRLRSDLDYQIIDDLIQSGLHEYIDGLQRNLNAFDQEVFKTFFSLQSVA